MLLNNKEELLEFIKLSNELGKNKAYIQGAGGNTSIKLSNSPLMAIKSSGYELCNINENEGVSFLNYKEVINYYQSQGKNTITDDSFNKFIYGNALQFNQFKPSIETSFHCFIKNKVVVHTHSVYANILTCSKQGYELTKEILNSKHNFVWVPYKTPGIDLALEINKALSLNESNIIMLENHGIIVSHSSMAEAIKLHESINNLIISFFSLPKFVVQENPFDIIEYARNHILFPDQIVYTNSDAFLNTQPALEVLCAYKYILENINIAKLTPNFLETKNADIISNMDSEKHRQNLIKK